MEAARNRPSNRLGLPSETDVMKEYSERLVCKLEQKNQELEKAKAELEEANRELESRVQQRTAELKAANQELESFSYSVSHDLRAPVRHIDGFVELLLRNGGDQLNEIQRDYLNNVRSAGQTMGKLIDALLELSRVTRADLKRRPVDLTALASEICLELQRGDPGRSVQTVIVRDIKADGDERLLRIVLVNLLSNAWKYSRKRADARIEFGKTKVDGVDAYFVRDNGASFDMAYADKLFGAFQRLHSDADFEGIGIGLATVQRIIRRHNGQIRAEGILNQGATFYFTLG
jgi:light-regulated signal transduction histidine kinase (bacteriophytochrome)